MSIVGKPVSDLVVLDVGTCLGTDLRQMLVDGARQVYGIDSEPRYFAIGNKMWSNGSDRDQQLVHCSACDVLDLEQLKRLELPQVDVIYSGSVLHLFSAEQGLRFAMNLFQLTPPRRADEARTGVLFGRTIGSTDRPFVSPKFDDSKEPQLNYLHSIDSLQRLLESVGFTDVLVQIPHESWAATMLEGRAAMMHFSARF